MPFTNVFVHHTAEISEKAHVGAGTKIWNQAQIREYAEIGEDCIISKDVYIDAYAIIGNRVKIQNRVNIYHGVKIDDDVFVGPSVTFTNDMYPRAFSSNWEISNTYVEKGASIGAGTVIRCGVTIGKYAMIGAGSVVVRDVDQYSLVFGNPAKPVAWVCRCGRKLQDSLHCPECGKNYRLLENGKIEYDD